ncbi:ribosomal protein L7/L12, putative [Perkinsus marinus ATCC 50983]|uniref:Ribosomal protein L7/L12, putative n=1 Tax=Perkinsus marinus (strain ATCC 50983 / TXsc) TaxID=423536 RepID=C5L1K1_PERM5|nr:ribosomal protein L7/L12, putative [Perkinsus marinus ATCC 50983]EER09428.1 ribosomal protein L7/L12, putative [Perkinsus marinus ATCC 50983]|eukprot:XP_002777612.1 ribosomal protein L7/L12, putative [Perkinsus marinus ATCC 50983]
MMCSWAVFVRRSCIVVSRRLTYQVPLVRMGTRAFSAEQSPPRDSSFDVFAKIKDKGDGKVNSVAGEVKKRKPSDKVIKLVDDILSLSLIEAADLCDLCQEKLAARSGGVPGRSPFPHPGAMFGGGMMASPMMMGMPAAPGGVLPQQQVATPQAGGDVDASEKADEKPAEKKKEPAKSVVTIKLVSYNTEKKVTTIKEVRAVTGLGLREAKDAVEGCPTVIKKGVPMEQAEEIKKKMESTGAQVEFV